jgi:hypothetical protein
MQFPNHSFPVIVPENNIIPAAHVQPERLTFTGRLLMGDDKLLRSAAELASEFQKSIKENRMTIVHWGRWALVAETYYQLLDLPNPIFDTQCSFPIVFQPCNYLETCKHAPFVVGIEHWCHTGGKLFEDMKHEMEKDVSLHYYKEYEFNTYDEMVTFLRNHKEGHPRSIKKIEITGNNGNLGRLGPAITYVLPAGLPEGYDCDLPFHVIAEFNPTRIWLSLDATLSPFNEFSQMDNHDAVFFDCIYRWDPISMMVIAHHSDSKDNELVATKLERLINQHCSVAKEKFIFGGTNKVSWCMVTKDGYGISNNIVTPTGKVICSGMVAHLGQFSSFYDRMVNDICSAADGLAKGTALRFSQVDVPSLVVNKNMITIRKGEWNKFKELITQYGKRFQGSKHDKFFEIAFLLRAICYKVVNETLCLENFWKNQPWFLSWILQDTAKRLVKHSFSFSCIYNKISIHLSRKVDNCYHIIMDDLKTTFCDKLNKKLKMVHDLLYANTKVDIAMFPCTNAVSVVKGQHFADLVVFLQSASDVMWKEIDEEDEREVKKARIEVETC